MKSVSKILSVAIVAMFLFSGGGALLCAGNDSDPSATSTSTDEEDYYVELNGKKIKTEQETALYDAVKSAWDGSKAECNIKFLKNISGKGLKIMNDSGAWSLNDVSMSAAPTFEKITINLNYYTYTITESFKWGDIEKGKICNGYKMELSNGIIEPKSGLSGHECILLNAAVMDINNIAIDGVANGSTINNSLLINNIGTLNVYGHTILRNRNVVSEGVDFIVNSGSIVFSDVPIPDESKGVFDGLVCGTIDQPKNISFGKYGTYDFGGNKLPIGNNVKGGLFRYYVEEGDEEGQDGKSIIDFIEDAGFSASEFTVDGRKMVLAYKDTEADYYNATSIVNDETLKFPTLYSAMKMLSNSDIKLMNDYTGAGFDLKDNNLDLNGKTYTVDLPAVLGTSMFSGGIYNENSTAGIYIGSSSGHIINGTINVVPDSNIFVLIRIHKDHSMGFTFGDDAHTLELDGTKLSQTSGTQTITLETEVEIFTMKNCNVLGNLTGKNASAMYILASSSTSINCFMEGVINISGNVVVDGTNSQARVYVNNSERDTELKVNDGKILGKGTWYVDVRHNGVISFDIYKESTFSSTYVRFTDIRAGSGITSSGKTYYGIELSFGKDISVSGAFVSKNQTNGGSIVVSSAVAQMSGTIGDGVAMTLDLYSTIYLEDRGIEFMSGSSFIRNDTSSYPFLSEYKSCDIVMQNGSKFQDKGATEPVVIVGKKIIEIEGESFRYVLRASFVTNPIVGNIFYNGSAEANYWEIIDDGTLLTIDFNLITTPDLAPGATIKGWVIGDKFYLPTEKSDPMTSSTNITPIVTYGPNPEPSSDGGIDPIVVIGLGVLAAVFATILVAVFVKK